MAFKQHYYSGQGSMFAAEVDPNTYAPKGFERMGNAPEVSIDIEVSKIEHKESESGQRLLDATLVTEKKGKFSITMENISLTNLAIGLYGASTTVANVVVTDEAHKFYKGKRVPLAHPNVTDVVVELASGGTALVLGTDYTVDAVNGVISPLETSATADDTAILVSYETDGYENLEAFVQETSPERALRFEGLNTIDGSRVIIDMFRAQFDPLTGYQLISDEIGKITLAGSLLANPNIVSGSKFFRQRNVAAT